MISLNQFLNPAARKRDTGPVLRVSEREEAAVHGGANIRLGDLIDAPLCPKGLIMMCGEMGALSREVSAWADRMGATLMVVSGDDIPVDWIRSYAPRMDFMLVDSDYLGDPESTVDFCMCVRRAVPQLPIILVSSEVRSHDFTCERMMACDATLKPPLMHRALTMGVQAAYQNNDYFLQSRGLSRTEASAVPDPAA